MRIEKSYLEKDHIMINIYIFARGIAVIDL